MTLVNYNGIYNSYLLNQTWFVFLVIVVGGLIIYGIDYLYKTYIENGERRKKKNKRKRKKGFPYKRSKVNDEPIDKPSE